MIMQGSKSTSVDPSNCRFLPTYPPHCTNRSVGKFVILVLVDSIGYRKLSCYSIVHILEGHIVRLQGSLFLFSGDDFLEEDKALSL